MHASTLLALCGLVAAIPAPTPAPELAIRDADDGSLDMLNRQAQATAPWVEVDDEGQPQKTHSPSITTDGGSTSVKDAAPHSLTASVYTYTSWGELTTSTGAPPNPTATGRDGQGAFSRCYNKDGPNKPFCRPSLNSTLYVGTTYYITWDPDFFNYTKDHSNTTYDVAVSLKYLNTTDDVNEWVKLDTYDKVPSAFGFWPFKVGKEHLSGHKINNVTISLLASRKGTNEKNRTESAIPVFITTTGNPKNKPTKAPTGRTLYIGIPAALGGAALLVFGLCLWNRKTRRIELGNLMSRSRNGYTGNRTRRMFRKEARKDNGIQLHDTHLPDGPLASPPLHSTYRDAPESQRARRDSDALGSLAGSPITGTFEPQGTTGGRNAFRDEMERQNHERRNDNMF